MPTVLRGGQRSWSMTRDSEGHRTYKITFRVRGATTDGPATVLTTPGLPLPGSPWLFDNDIDIWAWCRPDADISPVVTGEPNTEWDVEFTFSTKPLDRDKQRCQDTKIEDPLLEPPKVSGTFTKYTEEITHDINGHPVLNSSHEQIRGPQLEFDHSRPTIRIEQNVAVLGLNVFAPMIDTLNDATLWGVPRGCIKLCNASWERKYHGQCRVYYTRTFEFEIRAFNILSNIGGFVRELLDEGSKVLRGDWITDEDNLDYGKWLVDENPFFGGIGGGDRFIDHQDPTNFIRFKDWHGENCRAVLDGYGRPWDPRIRPGTHDYLGDEDPDSEPGKVTVEYYDYKNFLLLGIPTTL